LNEFFREDTIIGLPIEFVLTFSIIWSLKTLILLHLKTISTEKGFLPFTSKILIFLWGTMSTARRILSMVAFFIPSLGLFNVLYHWISEKNPFEINLWRKKSSGILELYNMTEKVLWSDIDRWNYNDVNHPFPPDYNLYTGLTLGQSFLAFVGLFVVHFLLLLIVKSFTVNKFWMRNHYNKFVHILKNMNIATPWQDWDHGKCSVEQHKIKHRRVNMEMAATMGVNMIISLLMICPLLYSGKKISIRHNLLSRTIGTKSEEDQSYQTVHTLQLVVTLCLVFFSLLEMVFYLTYNNMFSFTPGSKL